MDAPLLIVSNRGPLRFARSADGERTSVRGGGGVVAAEGPVQDGNLALRLVAHDREEYDRYYNVFSNPVLWLIHHYLWGLALEPSVDRNVRLAWEAGYVPVNDRFAEATARALG